MKYLPFVFWLSPVTVLIYYSMNQWEIIHKKKHPDLDRVTGIKAGKILISAVKDTEIFGLLHFGDIEVFFEEETERIFGKEQIAVIDRILCDKYDRRDLVGVFFKICDPLLVKGRSAYRRGDNEASVSVNAA